MLFVLLALVTCILLGLFTLYIVAKIKKDTSKYLTNVPCSEQTFPFGNTLPFLKGSVVYLDLIMQGVKELGRTSLFHDGPLSWVVITADPEFIELIYSSSTHITKGSQYDYFKRWLGQGLLISDGDKWRFHRKIITPTFHFSILQQFLTVFDTVGDNFVRKLQQHVGSTSVEISNLISLCTLDIICETAMGVKMNALDMKDSENMEYIKGIRIMCKIIVDRMFSFLHPIFYPLTLNYYREKRALKMVNGYVDNVISQKIQQRKELNQKEDKSQIDGIRTRLAFLDLLLEAKIDGTPLTKAELRDEVNTFMFEGHDTTSSAITFCLLMLATHPRVQDKVMAEQKEILEGDLKLAHPTSKELSQMKYLENVIKETLRLYPSVPLFSRKLGEDVEFKGNLYPKGITLVLTPYATHRDPDIFPEPEKFLPERFEESEMLKINPFAYTPFSAGSRNCIGQKFAMMEIKSTVSKVVRHFKLEPAHPEHQIQLVSETTLNSKNGVKISLQAR
uniref:CYP4BD1 n=1 Tax=Ips paraconfusus TaxID=89938 RepID=A1BPR9_9CUCU|nr:CYP4BD1 [Ips paraconfusus]